MPDRRAWARVLRPEVEGAPAIASAMELVVADDELANTDLMRQPGADRRHTVAQFGQAIGTVHYANFRRHLATDIRTGDRAMAVKARA